MVCSQIMKDALDDVIRGIDFNYKLDEVLGNLPKNQKFTAKQLQGYLTKQGVSPKEIEASGLLKGFESDNRALPASEWEVINSEHGKHRFNKQTLDDKQYAKITIGNQGKKEENLYHENLFIGEQKNLPTNLRHFSEDVNIGESLLGWNRIHQDTINGKPTTVLNEFQSDWLQAERQGAGAFKSKHKRIINDAKEALNKEDYSTVEDLIAPLLNEDYRFHFIKAIDDKNNNDILEIIKEVNIVEDFPMKPDKFHQLMIVDALNESIENDTKRVAIPINRENELAGTRGVTKFYDNLNKSILPDIRKKLEKQGMRIKLSKEVYKPSEFFDSEKFKEKVIKVLDESDMSSPYHTIEAIKDFEDSIGRKLTTREDWEALGKEYNYSYLIDDLFGDNELHVLEVVEMPNKKVKWDVYGLLSALGLEKYANRDKEEI